MGEKRTAKRRLRLTDATLKGLSVPEGGTEFLVWDTAVSGLAVRVGRRKRSWTYVYRRAKGAPPQKISLGQWPAVTVGEARKAAQIEAARVARGEDPAAARHVAERDAASELSAVLDAYDASLAARGYVNRRTALGTLRRGLSHLATRDLATITRREFVEAIERIEAAGRPGAAADLRTHSRTLLEWTTNRGTTPANVLAGLRRPRATRAQRLAGEERGRAIAADSLSAVWRAADPATPFGRYVRALILTGARRAELARLDWTMVKRDRLVLPPTHTKQGRPHEIPLVPALRDILDGCNKVAGRPVFASPVTGGEMKGWTQYVAKLRKASGVEFTLHDFRRTVRTGLATLGTAVPVAERMLGHQSRNVLETIYDKSDLWPARVAAATAWADFVIFSLDVSGRSTAP